MKYKTPEQQKQSDIEILSEHFSRKKMKDIVLCKGFNHRKKRKVKTFCDTWGWQIQKIKNLKPLRALKRHGFPLTTEQKWILERNDRRRR